MVGMFFLLWVCTYDTQYVEFLVFSGKYSVDLFVTCYSTLNKWVAQKCNQHAACFSVLPGGAEIPRQNLEYVPYFL